MTKHYVIAAVVALVGVSILNVVWHNVLFSSVYYEGLQRIAYVKDSLVAPRLPIVILLDAVGVAVTAFFIMYTKPLGSRLVHGAVIGGVIALLMIGSRGFMNYAVFPEFALRVAVYDSLRSIILGVLTGLVIVGVHDLLPKQAQKAFGSGHPR